MKARHLPAKQTLLLVILLYVNYLLMSTDHQGLPENMIKMTERHICRNTIHTMRNLTKLTSMSLFYLGLLLDDLCFLGFLLDAYFCLGLLLDDFFKFRFCIIAYRNA